MLLKENSAIKNTPGERGVTWYRIKKPRGQTGYSETWRNARHAGDWRWGGGE